MDMELICSIMEIDMKVSIGMESLVVRVNIIGVVGLDMKASF